MPTRWFWPIPKPIPITPTAIRLLAPVTFADGACVWPYTGVLITEVAAIAAAAVAAFFIKSRRGTPAGDVCADCSIRSYFNSACANSLQLLTKITGKKFAVNRTNSPPPAPALGRDIVFVDELLTGSAGRGPSPRFKTGACAS